MTYPLVYRGSDPMLKGKLCKVADWTPSTRKRMESGRAGWGGNGLVRLIFEDGTEINARRSTAVYACSGPGQQVLAKTKGAVK